MGFKTQVFNLQVLTQTEFETPPKSQFKPEKGHFLVYFKMGIGKVKDKQIRKCPIQIYLWSLSKNGQDAKPRFDLT